MDEQVKIWQRVRGETPPITDGLAGLTAGCLARAALYGTLARQLQGPGRSILLQLQENEQRCVRCMKGIARIAEGVPMNPGTVSLPSEKIEVALRKCYGREMRCLAAYEARSSHPEYGAVFGRLAEQEREHCMALLGIIGTIHNR